MKVPKKVTPAVMERNRQNAQKSTGPQTRQGKKNSRFNAVTHGLTARILASTPQDAAANPELLAITQDLRERYGSGDIVTEMLIDMIAADVWRQKKALEAEKRLYQETRLVFIPQGPMPTLHRYITGSRNSLLRNLELLESVSAARQSEQLRQDEDPENGTLSSVEERADSSIKAATEKSGNGNQDDHASEAEENKERVELASDGAHEQVQSPATLADNPQVAPKALQQNSPAWTPAERWQT